MNFSNLSITAEQEKTARQIAEVYGAFGVCVTDLIGIRDGARVTRYEFEVDPNTRLAKITRLRDDLSLMLGVPKVRLTCPLEGKAAFAAEVPKAEERKVTFSALYDSCSEKGCADPLCLPLGEELGGKTRFIELSKCPHLFMGGQRFSGKTTLIKAMLTALLAKSTPSEVKSFVITPKPDEYGVFPEDRLQIFSAEQTALAALQGLCEELEKRYALFEKQGVRCVDDYNRNAEPIPRITVFLDEFSFLPSRALETNAVKLLQNGRAAGIHLIFATGDLTPKTVSAVLKANIPERIALSVQKESQSRTVMDACGAECLLGGGDLLYCDRKMNPPVRVQAPCLTDAEIDKILNTK